MQKIFISLFAIAAISLSVYVGLTCGPSPSDIEKVIASPAYQAELEKRLAEK